MAWKLELRLPGITVANDDVVSLIRRRPRSQGPFVIVNRQCGLALDTAHRASNGGRPILWYPHAQLHQMWSVRPSRFHGEVILISATNRLVIDATREDEHPVMWESHGAPWQRWKLLDNPDGIGYRIQAVHNGRFLAANHDAVKGWEPWFDSDGQSADVQWLFLLPHGNKRLQR